MKKWLYYLLVGMFMDKVKNFCDHSIPLREMTDNLQTTGHLWTPPPHPLGLRLFIHAFMSTYSQSFEIFVDKKLSIWQSITNFQVSATVRFALVSVNVLKPYWPKNVFGYDQWVCMICSNILARTTMITVGVKHERKW